MPELNAPPRGRVHPRDQHIEGSLMRRDAIFATALALAAAGTAGCGGGSSTSSSSGSGSSTGGAYSQGANAAQTPTPSGSAAARIKVARTDIGPILTDGTGRTLYLFEKDKGTDSTCFGACATGWPPLTTKGTPTVISGGRLSELGTTTRPGGVQQVTYAGHPLYYFQGDKAPGQTTGEGLNAFGAEWYALSASGKKVEEEGDS
jgi:predicted lipoprotein with Yx(FWY)xxD motif